MPSAFTSLSRAAALPAGQRHGMSTHSVRLLVYLVQALLDAAAVVLGLVLADMLAHSQLARPDDAIGYWTVVPIFILVNFYARSYSFEAMNSVSTAILRVAGALGVTLAIHLMLSFALKGSGDLSRLVFFGGAALSLILLVMVRLPIIWAVRNGLGARFMRRIIVTDGVPVDVPGGFERFDAAANGITPDVANPIMLHNFSCLIHGADRVVVSCPPERRERWSLYLKATGVWGELLVPELHGIAPLHDEAHLGIVGIRVSTGPLDLRNRLLKRLFDLAITVPAIVVLTPVLLVTALAIKLDSPGPILFRQRRMGRRNQLFDVYKFRSMRVDGTDHDGVRSASRDDDRITRVGCFIRATSIDELPQLFNVLEGDMSLVGPRPHALGSLAGDRLFWHVDQRYWLRHAIKPGITGLAQVRGFRGATDHQDDLSNRLQSDLEYVATWSLLNDLLILARTALVLVHRNAY